MRSRVCKFGTAPENYPGSGSEQHVPAAPAPSKMCRLRLRIPASNPNRPPPPTHRLYVGLERVAALHDQLLGQEVGVTARGLGRLDDVHQDDVHQLVGDDVRLVDQRAEHVQHEALHLGRVLVTADRRGEGRRDVREAVMG